MGAHQRPAEMSFDFAYPQSNPLILQVELQLFQDLGGVDVHIHDGLGINQEEIDRSHGRLDNLLNPVGEVGSIKKEERPGKPVDQQP